MLRTIIKSTTLRDENHILNSSFIDSIYNKQINWWGSSHVIWCDYMRIMKGWAVSFLFHLFQSMDCGHARTWLEVFCWKFFWGDLLINWRKNVLISSILESISWFKSLNLLFSTVKILSNELSICTNTFTRKNDI